MPASRLTNEELTFLNGPTEELCRIVDDWKITNELKDLPPNVWEFMKKNKFFGIIGQKKYGGLGFSAQAHSAIVQKIATRSLTAAVTVMVPNSLGPQELLFHYGTEEQKNYYLPRLANGEEIPCFGLTEPEAGSDASSIQSKGVVCYGEFEGKKTLGVRLNWEKRYITLGPVATILGLAFKLYDPEHLLGEKENIGITIALIPTDAKGVSIGKRHNAMDTPFQVGPNWGRDVFIPIDRLLGGKERAGQGWKMLMSCLGVGRSISLPALSAGSAKLAAAAAGAYARIRKQFKTSIGDFEGVKLFLSEIGENAYTIDAIRLFTAQAVDSGGKPSGASAIAKYHTTERARQSVNQALDIFGGSGICLGPKNILGATYKSQPIGITVEGANILGHSMIIPGTFIMRCHPYVREEIEAIAEADSRIALQKFDKAISGHISFALKNLACSLWRGATGGRLMKIPAVNADLLPYYQHISRFSANYALVSDIAMLILGGKLKRKEALSSRLGDVVSEMYNMSANFRHFKDEGENEEDLEFVHLSCQKSLYKIQESFWQFLRNFPNRLIAKILKQIIFPHGRIFEPPLDNIRFKVADLITKNTGSRERLIEGIYIPSDKNEALGRLEAALPIAVQAQAIEKRIATAVKTEDLKTGDVSEAVKEKIITEKEALILKLAEEMRTEIIQVDAFGENKNKPPETAVYFIREED
ncbi:MAG: acyl-CoA dehydrogenase [Patescibacteria group bacterium]